MNKQFLVIVILLFSIIPVMGVSPVSGFEESDVLMVKTPAKILVEFHATRNVNDTIKSLNDADTRYLISKTPTSWTFSTNDTDRYDISLSLNYGNESVKQTLLIAVFSGGELVSQRYVELEGKSVLYKVIVTTGESIRYPTTDEIVDGVLQQVKGELYDYRSSLDYALRVIDANEKTFGTILIAYGIISSFLTIGIITIFLSNNEIRKYVHSKLDPIVYSNPIGPEDISKKKKENIVTNDKSSVFNRRIKIFLVIISLILLRVIDQIVLETSGSTILELMGFA